MPFRISKIGLRVDFEHNLPPAVGLVHHHGTAATSMCNCFHTVYKQDLFYKDTITKYEIDRSSGRMTYFEAI